VFSITAPTHNKRSGVWLWAHGMNGPGYIVIPQLTTRETQCGYGQMG
jgi:hypothetical protein